jgi:small GTP-binding protein
MTHCHGASATGAVRNDAPVVLVGNSNVGKSAVFAALTGRRVDVSNYPGTTVEIASGAVRVHDDTRTLIDTPGVRSTMPLSDDERVTRDALLDLEPSAVVQVVDAKNLRRGLLLTFELAETGLPVVVCLNMSDEAEARGIHVDAAKLARILGVPVVPTVAIRRSGIEHLRDALEHAAPVRRSPDFDDAIEGALEEIDRRLPPDTVPRRALALGLLADDETLVRRLELDPWSASAVARARTDLEAELAEPVAYALTRRRLAEADLVLAEVVGGLLGRVFQSSRPGPVLVEPLAPTPRETIPLSHVLPGREVQIVALREMTGPRASRLAAFGLVPGSRVEVLQRRPAPVLRVGETEIALSLDILAHIEVAPPEPATASRRLA